MKLPTLEFEKGKCIFKFKKNRTEVIFMDDLNSKLYTGDYSVEFWKRDRSMNSFVNKLKESYDLKNINVDELNRRIENLKEAWIQQKQEKVKELKKEYPHYTFTQLRAVVEKWLHFELNDLKIILACALDRKIEGEPVWLFLIAPPSNTKSEILRALEDGNNYYHLTSMSSNSLISGYIKPDGEKVEDLAKQLDGKVLVIKDFTVILTLGKDKRDEILSQLRDSYDGFISRKIGTIDEKIMISTRFGLIAGVTPVIDKFYSVLAQLGERFLKNRMNYSDDEILKFSEINEGQELEMREQLTKAIMGFLTNLEIKDVSFSERDIAGLKTLATWVAVLRTPVFSNWEGDELVVDIAPQHEKPARLYKQFKKLARLLANIEGETKLTQGVWKCLIKVARDTLPPDRLAILNELNEGDEEEEQLIHRLQIPKTSLRRLLYSMKRLGVLDLIKSQASNVWLNKWSVSDDFKLKCIDHCHISGFREENRDNQESGKSVGNNLTEKGSHNQESKDDNHLNSKGIGGDSKQKLCEFEDQKGNPILRKYNQDEVLKFLIDSGFEAEQAKEYLSQLLEQGDIVDVGQGFFLFMFAELSEEERKEAIKGLPTNLKELGLGGKK